MNSLIKNPSAWIPIAMPLAILAMLLYYLTRFGVVHEADEGTAAHLFQIWLVLEVFFVAFFAIKWLPKFQKQTFIILAIQIFVSLAACFPVFYFKL